MFRQHFDLPLGEDGSGRFVPWIVAVMVYLATLSVAAGMAVNRSVDKWNIGLEGTITVEIAASNTRAEDPGEPMARALSLLRSTAGVRSATPLADDEIARLLEPWLGQGDVPLTLPIPQLIDVRLEAGTQLDLDALGTLLENAVPGARLDDHQYWTERLSDFGRSVQVTSAFIVALVALAGAGTVIFATRAGLAIHREVIELMHLVGSRDSYIAGQFQAHAMSLSLRGGVVGLALGAATLGILRAIAAPIEGSLLPTVTITAGAWAVLAALPLLAGLIATITARVTVVRALQEMP
ncbi:MAG: cell division protein [Alphaproteobacteria bacterium]|jgi:cell division transport system permease protein|nr:cell division protein [Alphaproteobacteria bacterium]MBT4710921.1 cell division protein [Alphaproteobacteria bacterium]